MTTITQLPTTAACQSTDAYPVQQGALTVQQTLSQLSTFMGDSITALTGMTTPLSVPQGGTGGATQAAARTALGAAVSGANSDITALSGLTTALTISQGGTGGQNAPAALTALGAAALAGSGSQVFSVATPTAVAHAAPASAVPLAIATIAALRSNTVAWPSVSVQGYATTGDGGGGIFTYVSTDTTSADNGGTIIVDGSGHRYHRSTAGVTYDLRWFGATGNGSTNDSAAFATAVAATPPGATLHGTGTFLLSSNVAAPNVAFIINGSLTGSGLITGDGATVTYVSGTEQSAQTPFGSGFLAQIVDVSGSVNTHANSAATRSIVRTAVGSGTDSPATTDAALFTSSSKVNYLTSTTHGEIDGHYVIVRQGEYGDVGGIDIDLQKVQGQTGGGVGIQVAASWVNSSGTALSTISAIDGYLEGPGAVSGGTGYGYYSEAQAGTFYSAYHASQYGGAFDNIFTAASGRSPANVFFRIDAAGRIFGSAASAATPGYSFLTDNTSGMYLVSAAAVGISTGGTLRALWDSAGNYYPGTDAASTLGAASKRWSTVYAATGTINTSDENHKQDIEGIPDAVLDAWSEVQFQQFRYKDAVAKKGEKARKHVGLIAQSIERAFKKHGLDAFEYGLLCYDEWEDQYAPKYDRHGKELDETVLLTPAGSIYGVRTDECLFLEAALQRRKYDRLAAKVNDL